MMLLERWVVAGMLGLTVPLVSTAKGVPGPQQTGDTKTAQPSKTGANPEAQPTKADDAQDPEAGKPVEDLYVPPPKTDDDAQDPQAAKATDDLYVPPPKTGDDAQDAKAAKAADDLHAPPAMTADDQDAPPSRTRNDHEVQPERTGEGLKPQPASAAARAPDPSPKTPEQVKEQRKFEKDTARLLQLVQDLKVEVERAGGNTLSLAALRKADEIQKLAKALKEKMKEEEQVSVNKP
jgi:hypothetical protein